MYADTILWLIFIHAECPMNKCLLVVIFSFSFLIVCLLNSCKNNSNKVTAFYYWKAGFQLDKAQSDILQQAADNKLYLRFFDIAWDSTLHRAYPNAVINFKQQVNRYHITPVIYITNKVFESIKPTAIDSLASNCNKLIGSLATANKINYQSIQFDCDWTLSTKDKYFIFLRSFKNINHHKLQATIRLHQIKYKEVTGVPPVDRGVLMFYNMGKPNTGAGQSNSIYNDADAAKYIAYLPRYPIQLDVALPLFSWALHIRDHRVIQVYEKIKRAQLNNKQLFNRDGNNYTARKSFFLDGIYIKESDIFKLEETDLNALQKAAKQLSESLSQQNNRTIIYYELANLDLAEFNTENLLKVSARF